VKRDFSQWRKHKEHEGAKDTKKRFKTIFNRGFFIKNKIS